MLYFYYTRTPCPHALYLLQRRRTEPGSLSSFILHLTAVDPPHPRDATGTARHIERADGIIIVCTRFDRKKNTSNERRARTYCIQIDSRHGHRIVLLTREKSSWELQNIKQKEQQKKGHVDGTRKLWSPIEAGKEIYGVVWRRWLRSFQASNHGVEDILLFLLLYNIV